MADLFISYSRRNKDFVKSLHEALAAQKRDVWVDWEDIPPSVEWWKEIERGIEAANAFIFVVSPASVQSEVCYREVEHAVQNNKRIIPLLWEDVGGDLMQKMHPSIGAHNWIFVNDPANFDESMRTLASTIDTDYEHVREHTRLQILALEWERNGQAAGYLLRGDNLREAETWLANSGGKSPAPSGAQTSFIITSQQAQNQFQRIRFAFVSGALVLTLILTIFSIFQTQQAIDQRERADENAELERVARLAAEFLRLQEKSATLAQESGRSLEANDTELAILLALDAVNIVTPTTGEAQLALANAAYAPGARAVWEFDHSIISLAADDRFAVTGGSDGTLTIYDLPTNEIRFEIEGDDSTLTALALVGDTLAGGTADGEIILWNVVTGAEMLRWTAFDASKPIESLDFNGQFVVVGGSEGRVLLFDGSNGTLRQSLNGHPPSETVNVVAFSPDNSMIASGSNSLIVHEMNPATNSPAVWFVADSFVEDFHEGDITALDFSADSDQIVTGADDTLLKVWNLDVETSDSGTVTREINLLRTLEADSHNDPITDVQFGSSGFTLASASAAPEQLVILWDANTFTERSRLQGHSSTATDLAFFNSGLRLLSGSLDRSVTLWDAENGALLRRMTGQVDDINAVAFSSNGRFAASASDDTTIFIWDLTTQTIFSVLEGHNAEVMTLDFSPDGFMLATGDADGEILVWDVESGALLKNFTGHSSRVTAVAFSPDGSTLASGGFDRRIILWDVEGGTQLQAMTEHSSVVNALDFNPDGTRLLSGSKDRSVIVWELPAATPLARYENIGRLLVTSLDYGPDGVLALVGDGQSMFLLDTETGDILQTFRGHTRTVTDVDFSADGTLGLSASADSDVVLWDIETGEELLRLEGHRTTVNSVTFDPTGTRAMSGGSDETVVLWRVDSVNELVDWLYRNRIVEREYTCDERDDFGIAPCIEETPFPTRTPFFTPTVGPTNTPIMPTLDARTPSTSSGSAGE